MTMTKRNLFLGVFLLSCISMVFAEGGATGALTWTLENGVLTIKGEGAMPDYERRGNVAPWRSSSYSIKEVVIENGVTNIGNNAFYGLNRDGESIYSNLAKCTLPNSLTTIGFRSFCKCEGLRSINIPEGVVSIGESAFAECANLTQVSLPNTLATLDKWVFSGCVRLPNITLPESVDSIGEWVFYNCVALSSIAIPPKVTSISRSVFNSCTGLTSFTIPDQVTSIGDEAFFACTSLKSITISQGLTRIGTKVFSGCRDLKEFIVSDQNTEYASVDGVLFDKNKSLLILYPYAKSSAYNVPDGVVSIGEGAFAECAGLTAVTFPPSLTKIGNRAFSACKGLTTMDVSSGLTEIKSDAFYGCSSLKAFTASENNPVFSAVDGVLFNKDQTTLIFFPCTKSTFYTIPRGVISIGENAFYDCSRLTRIALPSSIQEIGDGAFSGCSGLIRITLPENVGSLGREAFAACTALRELHSKNSMPPTVGFDCFSEVETSICRVYVPNRSARSGYLSADGWSKFKNIVIEVAR